MTWQELWLSVFGTPPLDRTSREVAVQEAMARLIAGHKCDWFLTYEPTAHGSAFLRALWVQAFGDAPDAVEWFVSEYELPVPEEWRQDIRFTYRCPDFACGAGDRVMVLELKTERGSYSPKQMRDYLRLARHKLPVEWTDVGLLGPHQPSASPPHDDRQRYGELTWHDVVEPLRRCFPDSTDAEHLARFLEADLAAPSGLAAVPVLTDEDREQAAVLHALRLAPSVAVASASDKTERGIDVAFPTLESVRQAQLAVKQALEDEGHADRVSVWLWQPSSTGVPCTPAGAETDMELRLAPKLARRSVDESA